MHIFTFLCETGNRHIDITKKLRIPVEKKEKKIDKVEIKNVNIKK